MGNFPPATGAWQFGQPAGHRQFLTLALGRPFALDLGGHLPEVTMAFETWGTLNDAGSNALLIHHAWTGDSHVSGPAGPGHPTPGWWERLVGPGCVIDTDDWFVVCINVLGGCQGSTGPASIDPTTGRHYGPRFPVVTIRDMVRAQRYVADHLGVQRWHSVIGGSMGGMQSLEWTFTFPDRVGSLVVLATCAQATAQQIGWGAIGRRSIRLDPQWSNGDYYDAADGDGPHEGLSVARMVAQVTFRSDDVFTNRFGRELVADGNTGLWQRFEVERYLDYHGEKLVRRFDANSYLVVGKAMDLHDIARGRGGLEAALRRIRMPTLAIGIRSDVLYPTYQQRQIVDGLIAIGTPARYVEIDSSHGHDGFLLDIDQVGDAVGPFLQSSE